MCVDGGKLPGPLVEGMGRSLANADTTLAQPLLLSPPVSHGSFTRAHASLPPGRARTFNGLGMPCATTLQPRT